MKKQNQTLLDSHICRADDDGAAIEKLVSDLGQRLSLSARALDFRL